MKEVTVEEAHRMWKSGGVLIDVRTVSETELGVAEGALCIPLDELPSRIVELDSTADTYLICRSGHRSGIAAEFLIESGFSSVSNVQGGYLAWKASGLPSE